MEVRRLLEPAATGLAAPAITDDAARRVGRSSYRPCRTRPSDPEHADAGDVAFHRAVIASTGNETLTSLLDGLSGRTVRARVWRGIVLGNVTQATIDEHRAIYDALRARDPFLAQSAALLHVNTSESWLRTILEG